MFGKEKRFVVKHKESFQGGYIVVVVDNNTGVNYVSTLGFGPASFSPLLDENGKVIVDK